MTCPSFEQFVGDLSLAGSAAPLRGSIGCVDLEAHALRTTAVQNDQDAFNIYGPMEAGFSSRVPNMDCLGDATISGGIDTNLAEHMVHYICGADSNIEVLDACGGHAVPYHYHERMSCLYTADPTTGHSTRIGTAGDGRGIYGKHIAEGVEPDDLDACGGRSGITPDSNGEVVYYYMITSYAPFSVGCYGPVSSVQECRDMYPDNCSGDAANIETVTTLYGTGQYQLDCPCFDKDQSNVEGQGRPGYLEPLPETQAVMTEAPTEGPVTPESSTSTLTFTLPPMLLEEFVTNVTNTSGMDTNSSLFDGNGTFLEGLEDNIANVSKKTIAEDMSLPKQETSAASPLASRYHMSTALLGVLVASSCLL